MKRLAQSFLRNPARRWIFLGWVGWMLVLEVSVAKEETGRTASAPVSQHDVIPILLLHCTACHGATVREGGLDLRTVAQMLKGGKSGPALVPGKPDESLMVKRVRSGECPPSKRLVEAGVKPVEAGSLARLTEWIQLGAKEALDEPDLAGTSEDPLVSAKDREFWSFQSPKVVGVPTVRQAGLVWNPIDAFILEKLEAQEMSFAPEASKGVLLRRVHFDLTGLPPSPEEMDQFLADEAPEAYERMVDRLLASPRYGERWGRYWLDVAGYSDAEGRREQHLPRLFAYRYRDYVIRSFNEDKPYDRFLLEQIAGDELADYEKAEVITQEIYDNLVATGFLRMGPDPTWANITGFVPDRLEVVADSFDVFGSGVLGLTLKCARCHDHKFDPIPQRDYFKLVDLFKGALDEYNWLKPDQRPYGGAGNSGPLGERSLPFIMPEERAAWERDNRKVQEEIEALTVVVKREEARLKEKFIEHRLAEFPETMREEIRRMLATAHGMRTEAQVKLAEQHEKALTPTRADLQKLDPEFKKRTDELGALEGRKRPEPRIAALWDRGDPSPTYLYRRGDPQRSGGLVRAGIPAVLSDGKEPFQITPPWPGSKKTGRRLALARWLTRPDHPLTGRVMVNRIWKHHFGRGIVKTIGNFGRTGEAPTHPELLDWLAGEFVRREWRVKSMHRLILTSRTYRQSSSADANATDPENKLLSRMLLKRLEAEALWDTCLAVAGCLNEARFGPAIPVSNRPDGLVVPGKTGGGWRRSIYNQQLRKEIPTVLEVFDLPAMNPNCLERSESIVAPQALHMMNDAGMRELANRFASRLMGEPDVKRRIDLAFRIALARPATAREIEASASFLSGLEAAFEPAAALGESGRVTAADGAAREKAWGRFCHTLMNSAEFIWID